MLVDCHRYGLEERGCGGVRGFQSPTGVTTCVKLEHELWDIEEPYAATLVVAAAPSQLISVGKQLGKVRILFCRRVGVGVDRREGVSYREVAIVNPVE